MSQRDVERRVVDAERVLTGVTYGPATDADGYVLTLITADGPLEVEFDEEAMYLLWTEVRGTPWPDPPTPRENDLLVKRRWIYGWSASRWTRLRARSGATATVSSRSSSSSRTKASRT
jgi:hypothetical protein